MESERMRGASGERYTWKVSGAETGEAYALIEAEVPPNAGPPDLEALARVAADYDLTFV